MKNFLQVNRAPVAKKTNLLFNQSFGTVGSPNQTGETLTRENRIGLMSYLRRTLMLLFAILVMSVANIGMAWGDTELVNINLSSWSSQSVSAGGSVSGYYFKSAATITNGSGWVKSGNASNTQHYIGIPLSGINGSVTITVTHYSSRPTMAYRLVTGNSAYNASYSHSSSMSTTRIGSNGTTTTITINNLSGSYGHLILGASGNATNGTFYISNIVVTTPVAATSHSVSAVTSTGTNTYGTVSAAASSVAEGGTTTITAVPASGYRVTNWAVSGTGASISPTGASNSTTTTLTMGTANATVTVTFGAIPTHTITYTNTKSMDNSANPTSYYEGVGVASFTKLRHAVGYDFTGWSPSSISSSATTDQTIDAQWTARAAAAGTGTLTYALAFGTSTITTSSITRNNGALYDATDVSIAHTTFNDGAAKNGCSGKLTTTSAKDASNYVELTFKIADGYTFTPTEVQVRGNAVSTAKTMEVELKDNAATPNTKSVSGSLAEGSTSGGSTVTLDFDASGTVTLEGTVTLKIFVYGATNHWRLGTSIIVTGTVASAAPSCTAPSSVTVTGTNKYLAGQTISLTATPTGGSGTATYQWQKEISSVWTNVENGSGISGATSNNLQIASCDHNNSGQYRCVVSTGATCSTNSGAYGVHVFSIHGAYYGGEYSDHEIVWSSGTTGTATIHLNASSTYMFKVWSNDGYYYGNGDKNYIIQPVNWNCGTDNSEMRLLTGPEGDYTFTVDIENALDNGTYVNLQVNYPNVEHPSTGYMYITKWWDHCYVHYWEGTNNDLSPWGYDPEISSDRYVSICGTSYWYFPVISTYNKLIAKDAAGDPSNTTGDQVSTDHGGMYITHSGSWGWHDFATYDITFDKNGADGGTDMTAVEDIVCNGSVTLDANTWTKTGYSFNGWKDGSSNDYADEATISNICGDIELTAQWNVNSYNLTWNLGGGTTTSAGTGIASGVSVNTTSSVAYGTSLTAPTVTKANYDFSAWSPAVASTMPAAATTYTATWTAKKYNVTTSLTDMTVSSGTTGDNAATYGTNYSLTLAADDGYVLPASITVTIGGDAAPGGSYSYNSSTGVVTITGSYITGAIVITAAGAENVFYVTYAANGGSGSVPTDNNAYDPDDEVTVLGKNTLSKSGYTFCGWSYNGYVYVEGDKFNITESATLTAVWNQNATTVTLTHFGKQFKTSDPRRGYAYVGSTSGTKYIIESNSSDVKNSDGDSSAIVLPYSNKFLKVLGPGSTTSITDSLFSNVTQISFKWKYVGSTTTYTTGIDVYVGSTKVETKSLTGNKNDSYATATVSNIASLSGAVKFVNTGTSSSNQKFWLDDIAITYSASTYKKVSFNKGSGPSTVSGLPADRYVPSGSKIAEPATDPTAANYIFNGWVTESGGSTPFDFANTPITTDKTIYAKWTAKTSPGSGTVSGTTSICSGNNTNVTLSTSVSGASYQLYKDNVASGDPKPGTGSALNWSVSAAGTYTVKAVETATHASGNMSGSATISIYTALSKTSDPTASQTATVGQGCALSGLTYAGNANVACQWQSCTDATPSSASNISDGGAYSNCTTSAMTFTPASAGTYYFRCVVSDDCGSSFNTSVVTVTAKVAPNDYTLSGTTSICSGDNATLTLSGSDDGVTYKLYKGGVDQSDDQTGDGNELTWTVSAAGTYTVKVEEDATYAEATMSGSAVITVTTATSITNQPATSPTGHDGVSVTLGSGMSVAGASINYKWYSYTSSGGAGEAVIAGATSATYAVTKSAGTYYYKVEVIGTCGSVKSNMITLTVDNKHLLTYDANNGSGAPGSSYIAPGSTTLSSTIPTRSGYVFLGWNTNNSGTGDMYQPGATYTMPAIATTLYAAWGSPCFSFSKGTKNTEPTDGFVMTPENINSSAFKGGATLSGGTLTNTSGATLGINGSYGFVMVKSTRELTLTLTGGQFQAGTVIALEGYTNSNSTVHTYGFSVSGNAATPLKTATASSYDSFKQRYVVRAGDGIEGTSTCTITMNTSGSGSQTYLSALYIGGCMSCTGITPTLSYSATTLYAFGGTPHDARPTLTGNTGNGAVTWISSNTEVVTVNSSGVVTAVGCGSAKVTAVIEPNDGYCGATRSVDFTVPALVNQSIRVGKSTSWNGDGSAAPDMTFNDPTSSTSQVAVIANSGYTFNATATSDKDNMTAKFTGTATTKGAKYVTLKFKNATHNLRLGEVIARIQPVSTDGKAQVEIYEGSTLRLTSSEVTGITQGQLNDVRFTFASPYVFAANTNIEVRLYFYGQTNGFRLGTPFYVNGGVLVDQKFTNAAGTGLWSDPANWNGGSLPEIYHDVVIEKPVNVDITDAVAKSVVIYNNGSTKTGTVEINPGKELVVAETIKKTTDGSAKIATTSSDLYIGSDASHGNGALVAGSASANTEAGVAFYTKARKEDGYVNQFIGVPLASMTAYDGFYGMYVYGYDDVNDAWKSVSNNGAMYPFTAYNLLRKEASATTLYMAGTLNLPGTSGTEVLSMGTRTGSKASDYDYLFANSWTAPIDVASIETTDFSNAEAVIYIFNAGTKSDYDTNGGNYTTSKTNNPGQWLYMPVATVKASPGDFSLTVIPSMEAFMVKKSSASSASLTLDYKKHVYDPAVGGTATVVPNRAPRRQAADELTRIRLYVTGESGPADNLLMFEREDFSTGFDNGWEARKIMGSAFAPQMYAMSEDGKMAINCVPNLEGTVIGFKAGTDDENYTFSFDYDEEAEELYLLDIQTGVYTRVTKENSYAFFADDKEEHNRFILTRNAPGVLTGLNEVQSDKDPAKGVFKFIENDKMYILYRGVLYDATGKKVSEINK